MAGQDDKSCAICENRIHEIEVRVTRLENLIIDRLDVLLEKIGDNEHVLSEHIKEEHRVFASIQQGFPSGDLHGHRSWHEEQIDVLRARKEFWRKMTVELVKWGLLGFLAWATVHLWQSALKGP